MKLKKQLIKVSLFLLLYIIFAFTDIYVFGQLKLVYMFSILSLLSFIKRGVKIPKEFFLALLWYLSYFLAFGHIISVKDVIVVCAGQLILFLVYLYFANFTSISKIQNIEITIQLVLFILILIGLIQLVLYYLIGGMWGISHVTHGVGLPRMRGLSSEPDWYGVICMMEALFLIVNISTKNYLISYKRDCFALSISLSMMVLSLTRAAWVGFSVGLLVFLFLKNNRQNKLAKRRFFRYLFRIIPIIAFVLIVFSLTNNDLIGKVLQRLNFTTWNNNDGGAAGSRMSSIEIMLYYFKKHPLTGNGVGSMNYIANNSSLLNAMGYYYSINAGRGNANLIITNLFDVGIIGTIFLVAFLLYHLWMMIICYKKTHNYQILALFMVLLALMIDFQFNNGIRLPYVWLLLGISTAHLREIKKDTYYN